MLSLTNLDADTLKISSLYLKRGDTAARHKMNVWHPELIWLMTEVHFPSADSFGLPGWMSRLEDTNLFEPESYLMATESHKWQPVC